MKQFEYSSVDLESSSEDKAISKLDLMLLSEWKAAMQNGLFKFKLDSELPTRSLNGKYAFIVQSNPKRFAEKRPSEIKPAKSISPAFDKNKFNFTKINQNEFLFKLVKTDEPKQDENYVVINNSPIELGHVLIVPKLKSCLNQVIDFDSIRIGCEFMLLSNSNHIMLGFNSILAYSSVNHLHLQAYYLNAPSVVLSNKNPFPIQNVNTAIRQLNTNLWFISDQDYLMPAFSLQLCDFNNDIQEFSRKFHLITNYLNKNDIPHNIVLVRCPPFLCVLIEKKMTIRAVVWPKRPAYGNKSLTLMKYFNIIKQLINKTKEIVANDKNICFAICELAGHFLLPNDFDFEDLSEEYLLKIAQDAKLDPSSLNRIKDDVLGLFHE